MKIYVTTPDGVEHDLEALEGWSVMEVIKDYNLPLKAECGGACCCATCHVYVDAGWVDKLYPMRDDEEEMLDEATDEVKKNSRLSCQIIMTKELDGLKVIIAPGEEFLRWY